jgi:hypothetical protein
MPYDEPHGPVSAAVSSRQGALLIDGLHNALWLAAFALLVAVAFATLLISRRAESRGNLTEQS